MKRKTRKEPEHSVRVVYLVVDRRTGKADSAYVTRDYAREENRWLVGHKVVRCEVIETKRKGGGA